MINKYVLIGMLTLTCTTNSMEKKFETKDIISLAQTKQTHQPFIETHFALQLTGEKSVRDMRYIELQNEVHRQTQIMRVSDEVRTCVLRHLWLAYNKKELKLYENLIPECEAKINSLMDELNNKK